MDNRENINWNEEIDQLREQVRSQEARIAATSEADNFTWIPKQKDPRRTGTHSQYQVALSCFFTL